MAYDPSALTVSAVLYVTPTADSPAFRPAYPAGQTLVELSPLGETCQAVTLDPWPAPEI
jgi:hypothetical protein